MGTSTLDTSCSSVQCHCYNSIMHLFTQVRKRGADHQKIDYASKTKTDRVLVKKEGNNSRKTSACGLGKAFRRSSECNEGFLNGMAVASILPTEGTTSYKIKLQYLGKKNKTVRCRLRYKIFRVGSHRKYWAYMVHSSFSPMICPRCCFWTSVYSPESPCLSVDSPSI